MDSPMCLIENVDGELRVVPDAIKYLHGLNQDVVVVAVVGLYRTGKSYLMNKLAGNRKGFALGDTVQSKTKGIWMWCVPHPVKRDHTLVLLDTEGLGDVEKGDSKNDAWIFSLAILLSSTLVYNSRGTIDNQAVENLQYVTEMTERIKVKSSSAASSIDNEEEEDMQFVQFFPDFVWAIRDFTLRLEIDGRNVTEDEYLEHSLEIRKGGGKKNMMYNLPRECIRKYFPSRKCFVFTAPANPDKMSQLDSMDENELCADFLKVADNFCSFIFKQSRVKTVKGGHKVTGRMLGHLVNTYVSTIASGAVPCLENAVLAMAQIENQAAVDEGLAVYQKGMEEVKALFPVDMGHFSAYHLRSDQQATQVFMSRSFKDENGVYLTALAEAISKHHADLLIQNEDASEKRCKALLEKLSAPISQKITEGNYAMPGGYEVYCNHHDNLVAQYRAEPNKGVGAEEVLDHFLREKSLEKSSILQADKKMTENEKKIFEEKERAAVLEQERKAAVEKQTELERIVEDDRKTKDDKLKQMEEKMKEHLRQQENDFSRALECKMKEQKDLLEKGHKEKADLMRQEIEGFKKIRTTENQGEETETRVLAEQAVRMETEKQQQLEKQLQDYETCHQENIRLLEVKMTQEVKDNQKELQRAIDSKLQEQKKLMAKGFAEKEAAMKEEMQKLREEAKREEKEQQSQNQAMMKGVIESVSNGLGQYFNYKTAREKRKAIVFTERARNSTPKFQSGAGERKEDNAALPKLKTGNNSDKKILPKDNTGTTV